MTDQSTNIDSARLDSTSLDSTRLDSTRRITELRDIVCDTFSVGPEEVETATSFRTDLDVDSIDGIELLTRLEQRFNIVLSEDVVPRLMMDLRTVYDVVAESGGW